MSLCRVWWGQGGFSMVRVAVGSRSLGHGPADSWVMKRSTQLVHSQASLELHH